MEYPESLLHSTKNTRYLLPGYEKYIRSDAPLTLDREDIAWLREHHVTTAVDLRSNAERRCRPCPFSDMAEMTYIAIPITGGDALPASADEVALSYFRMLDVQAERAVYTIENAKENVIFFCTAGKDRTGVISALLLKRMGISDDSIAADYVKSGDMLKEMLRTFIEAHPERDYSYLLPKENYMRQFLAMLDKRQDLYRK